MVWCTQLGVRHYFVFALRVGRCSAVVGISPTTSVGTRNPGARRAVLAGDDGHLRLDPHRAELVDLDVCVRHLSCLVDWSMAWWVGTACTRSTCWPRRTRPPRCRALLCKNFWRTHRAHGVYRHRAGVLDGSCSNLHEWSRPPQRAAAHHRGGDDLAHVATAHLCRRAIAQRKTFDCPDGLAVAPCDHGRNRRRHRDFGGHIVGSVDAPATSSCQTRGPYRELFIQRRVEK